MEDLQQVQGCAKGKHQSKHHTKYNYAARCIYMRDLVSFSLMIVVIQHIISLHALKLVQTT